MKISDKREVAGACLKAALTGDFKKASQIRQKAYFLNPPGTIGTDWSDFNAVWEKDKHFLESMEIEPFSDLDNSKSYIQSLKAGIFVDHIFSFRDNWAVICREGLCSEKINCPLLERFLQETGFDLPSVSRVHTYAQTKQNNINVKMHEQACEKTGLKTSWKAHYFPVGEYDLGIEPGASKRVIDGRRKWLEDYALFEEMRRLSILGFPKTFQTFQKHKIANSPKYQNWAEEYGRKRR